MYTFSAYSSGKNLPVLEEGVNDPAIFKAVFMAGGPGSGKSYIIQQLGLKALGFRPINIDIAFEMIAKKANFSLKMSEKEMARIEKLRDRAREVTNATMNLALKGRLGLIIDGTGKDAEKIAKTKQGLESAGYETLMVMVNTSLETALERNAARPRSVPEKVVTQSWKEVQGNLGRFQSMFGGSRFVLIDNNDKPDVNKAYRTIMKFAQSAPRSDEARKWIRSMKK